MRLRSGRISPAHTEMSPYQRFPFKFTTAALPQAGPDYHLVHTSIPNIFRVEQPRSFPQQSVRFLASFANAVSNSDNAEVPASTPPSDPLSTGFTQGRLHCSQHQKIPPNRFISLLVVEVAACRPCMSGGWLFFQKVGSPR